MNVTPKITKQRMSSLFKQVKKNGLVIFCDTFFCRDAHTHQIMIHCNHPERMTGSV
jgi:hypothetical protein